MVLDQIGVNVDGISRVIPPRKTKIPTITRDDILPEANRVSMASIEPNATAGGGCKEICILHIHRVLRISRSDTSYSSSREEMEVANTIQSYEGEPRESNEDLDED